MKIVALVPIKLNSKRLPQKNIKAFSDGRPLCHYILTTLLKVEMIENVYVYCSDPEIKQYIPEDVLYVRRSACLDQDSTKINEVLQAFANDIPADIYVMAHTTAPFLRAETINKGISAVISGKYDSAFSAQRYQNFLWKDNQPLNYELNNIPRTQDLTCYYAETSGFYIYERNTIIQEGRRIGNHPYIVEVGEIEGIDIDKEEDFIMADAIYSYYMKRKNEH